MRCIAIDDEPIALEIISRYCQRYGQNIELSTFTDPLRGIDEVRRTRPELLFLDIEMGDVNGVELARTLPEDIHLIFTTAYSQFAVDGFDLGAIDFLHKPFSYSRFEKAIERAIERSDLNILEQHNNNQTITIKVEYKSITITLNSIEYIEAMGNYLKIYLFNSDRPLLSQITLKTIEQQLTQSNFIRVHRSFIVSRRAIKNHNKREIELKRDGKIIPIGRLFSELFSSWI